MSIVAPEKPRRLLPDSGRVVMENVSWDYYQRTIKEFENSNVRVNYFRGKMELYMPGVKHERIKTAIARLLETYSTLANVRIEGLGSVTCFREDVHAGLEPDECFYITSPLPPLSPHQLDLSEATRPDLAVEVDVFSSSVPRHSIYAEFGVPEIWMFDGRRIRPNIRQADGTYQVAERSEQLPSLDIDAFSRFVVQAVQESHFDAARAMKQWLDEK